MIMDCAKQLREAVRLACDASSMPAIQRGRDAVATLPRGYVIEHIESIAADSLDLDDEWHYRRYVELCEQIDGELFQRALEQGQQSSNPEVC